MGKTNVIKEKKRKDANHKGTSGIPNWVMTLIVVVIAAAVLLTFIGGLISSSGIILRLSTAMKLDDIKINGNMMSYYFYNTYESILSSNETYVSYFSLDTSKPLKDQTYGVAATEGGYAMETVFLGSFTGTWYDYFMTQTKTRVQNMLMYCYEAEQRGITLSAEDHETIDLAIENMTLMADLYGYTKNAYFANMYGEGVHESDIRKAMEISSLASKCAEVVLEELEGKVTDDRVNAAYNENSKKFNLVDTFTYDFYVSYTSVAREILGDSYTAAEAEKAENKTKIIAAYKEKITEAKAAAAELEKITDYDKFVEYVLTYNAKKDYDDLLDAEKVAAENKPTDEELVKIKDATIAAVIAEIMEGKEKTQSDVVKTEGTGAEATPAAEGDASAKDVYTLYDIVITEKFAQAMGDVKEALFADMLQIKDTSTQKKIKYDENNPDDELNKWLFESERKIGDIKKIEEGDSANGEEYKDDLTESFSAEVSYLTKTSYKDETITRDIAYMLFASESTAKEALELIKKESSLTKDRFAEIATEAGASANTVLENYIEETMGSDAFDAWAYGESTTKGSYTSEPIKLSDGSYLLGYYVEDGDIAWYSTVYDYVLSEDYKAFEANLTATHGAKIVTNAGVLKLIGD